jgi:hypothetical protein
MANDSDAYRHAGRTIRSYPAITIFGAETAGWIAPVDRGVNARPVDFAYARLN